MLLLLVLSAALLGMAAGSADANRGTNSAIVSVLAEACLDSAEQTLTTEVRTELKRVEQQVTTGQQEVTTGQKQVTTGLQQVTTGQQEIQEHLTSVQIEVQQQMAAVQQEVRQQLTSVQIEVQQQMAAVQQEVRQQLTSVQIEVQQQMAAVQQEVRQQLTAVLQQLTAVQAVQKEGQTQMTAVQQQLTAIQQQLTAVQTTCRDCPTNWVRHDNVCYLLTTTQRALGHQADAACTALDHRARLVSVHPSNKDHVARLVTDSGLNPWIGLYRLSGGSWGWRDGTTLDFTNWRQGQPDNFGGEQDCVAVDGDGTWYDIECHLNKNIICQISLG